jgi:uncharacterized protein (TIGR03437 family)
MTDIDNLGVREYPKSGPIIANNLFANMAPNFKPVSPGEIVSIIGRGLAIGQTSEDGHTWSNTTPWADKLGGTEILINDRPVPLLHVGRRRDNNALAVADAEVIAYMPYTLIPGTEVTIQTRLTSQSGSTCVGNKIILKVLKTTTF